MLFTYVCLVSAIRLVNEHTYARAYVCYVHTYVHALMTLLANHMKGAILLERTLQQKLSCTFERIYCTLTAAKGAILLACTFERHIAPILHLYFLVCRLELGIPIYSVYRPFFRRHV